VDTLAFCLSKGLGAPFGGLLCGTHAHIQKALAFRQLLGGGMRQAGVLAAAGIVGLTTGLNRLSEDHGNAKRLANGLAALFPGSCEPAMVETNLFFIQLGAFDMSGRELANYLKQNGILVFEGDPQMRLATHCDVDRDDIDRVISVFARLKKEMPLQ
jgi:threonine aldolase